MYGQNFVPPRLDYSWQYLKNDRWISNNYSICGHPLWVGLSENRCSKLPGFIIRFPHENGHNLGVNPPDSDAKKITLVLIESFVWFIPINIQENPGWIIIIITKPKLTQTLPFLFHHNKNMAAANRPGLQIAILQQLIQGFPDVERIAHGHLPSWPSFFGKFGHVFWEMLGNSGIHANSPRFPPKNGCDW